MTREGDGVSRCRASRCRLGSRAIGARRRGLEDRSEPARSSRKTAIAEYREGRVTVRRRRPAGCFVYGPYWQIPAGHYRLRFCCAARRPLLAGEPALGVEILALGRFQQVWQDFTAGELEGGRAALAFAVPPELGPEGGSEVRFEFRFFHFGNADLALAAVMLDEAQGGDRPPRRWRLFGRLRGRAIGLRQSERAHLRRW
ncbi:MAG: hypothetical protein ACREFK_20100, partial [Stellaceae bacterium]